MASPKMAALRSSPSIGNDYSDPRFISRFLFFYSHDTQLLENAFRVAFVFDTVYYSPYVFSQAVRPHDPCT